MSDISGARRGRRLENGRGRCNAPNRAVNMNGNTTRERKGEEITDHESPGVDGLADSYELANVGEWDAMVGGYYRIGSITPDELSVGGESSVASWEMEDGQFSDKILDVGYSRENVTLTADGKGPSCRSSVLASLTPGMAKELGSALQRAGEELDRRRKAEAKNNEGRK